MLSSEWLGVQVEGAALCSSLPEEQSMPYLLILNPVAAELKPAWTMLQSRFAWAMLLKLLGLVITY